MKASRYKGGKFLNVERVDALTEAQRITTIDHIEIEEINGKDKPVAHLKGIDEPMPLGAENLDMLTELARTEEMDDWRGLSVEIYVDPSVKMEGRRVGGVRFKAGK